MKKRLTLLVALVMAICLVLGACSGGGGGSGSAGGGSEPAASGDAGGGGDLSICFLGSGLNTFGAALRDAAQAKADEMGVKFDYLNADSDVNTQTEQIENAAAKGYDAIILMGVEGNVSIEPIIKADIPLVVVNMRVDDERYDVYVGSDDVEAGRMQGEWLAEATGGECKIGLLYVYMGCSTQIERYAGLKESLLDKYPDAEVVVEDDGQAMMDEGMRIMEDWLQVHPEINVIAAQNDAMALGAMQAILAAGKKDDIIIAGVDADPNAVQAIADGTFDMTVFQDAVGQGSTAVETAVGLVNGETYEKWVKIPFVPIDSTNVADYLE